MARPSKDEATPKPSFQVATTPTPRLSFRRRPDTSDPEKRYFHLLLLVRRRTEYFYLPSSTPEMHGLFVPCRLPGVPDPDRLVPVFSPVRRDCVLWHHRRSCPLRMSGPPPEIVRKELAVPEVGRDMKISNGGLRLLDCVYK